MAVFAIEHNQEYSNLLQRLEACVNENNIKLKGKEKEMDKKLDRIEFAFHKLLGQKQFVNSDYFKLKLQEQ
jgi:hypothetical protein